MRPGGWRQRGAPATPAGGERNSRAARGESARDGPPQESFRASDVDPNPGRLVPAARPAPRLAHPRDRHRELDLPPLPLGTWLFGAVPMSSIATLPILRGLFTLGRPSREVVAQTLLERWRRSSLKYNMGILLSNVEYFIEKQFHLSIRVWISILKEPNSCREAKFLVPKVPKVPKKYYHIDTLEIFHL